MRRSQLILEEWQYESLRALSEREGKSVSGKLREMLSEYLSEKGKGARSKLREIEGIGADAKASGRDHDQHLYGKKR